MPTLPNWYLRGSHGAECVHQLCSGERQRVGLEDRCLCELPRWELLAGGGSDSMHQLCSGELQCCCREDHSL